MAVTLNSTGVQFADGSQLNFYNGGGIMEFGQTISASQTITSGKNAISVGPIYIASGVTITVPSGSVWTIL